jgi:DNA-directed RNA polymerase alpha subunit
MRRIFLHCVDSRIEENGTWYSRRHLGPFPIGLATTLATALRRSRLTDLPFLAIQAIELEGAAHEYSRLAGVHEPVLDLLLRFREVAIAGKTDDGPIFASFEARGPGPLRSVDLHLPTGRHCIQPEFILANLAPGAVIRGRVLISGIHEAQLDNSSNWLKVPGRLGPVRRVGFRIEDAGPIDRGGERIVFEIATDGTIAPPQALRQSAERLVRLFLGVVGVSNVEAAGTIRRSTLLPRLATTLKSHITSPVVDPTTLSFPGSGTSKGLGELAIQGYRVLAEPLGLDLGNLNLSFSGYQHLRNQGILTVGQLVDVLATPTLEPWIRNEASIALRRLGLS